MAEKQVVKKVVLWRADGTSMEYVPVDDGSGIIIVVVYCTNGDEQTLYYGTPQSTENKQESPSKS